MAVTEIPTTTLFPNYVVEVDLDGVFFKLAFKFNERDDAWFLDILDPADTPLRNGLKIVNEWDILRLWQEATRPDGTMITVNEGDIVDPPTLNQLGAEVILTYLDASEIAAAGG